MSLTTYSGLIAAIPAWTTYSDVSDYLDDFISWANQEVNRRLRANVMLATSDLTINAETISQPTGFLAFKRLYLDLSPREKITVTSPEGALDLSATRTTGTYPTHVAKEGSLLRFAPLFSGSATGKALYYKEMTAPSGSNATNAVLTAYPYLYLFGALEALHTFKEDDNNADRFGQKFGALIEDINSRDANDTSAGSIQTTPYAGGVI